MEPIYVVGHKNPDNDSITAAVAYAYLRNELDDERNYVPVRLGSMPKETEWTFAQNGLDEPAFVDDVTGEVILVDHNECAQSAPSVCAGEATVVGIIDHHRIGDVQTSAPIMFLGMPVGSTATIVTGEYRRNEVEIPDPIAAILLSAVLTDTVILKSPTTTDTDREVVDYLSRIVGIDPVQFGMDLFNARMAGEEFDAGAALSRDAKEFRVGQNTVLIAQYETVDAAGTLHFIEELREEAQRLVDDNDYRAVVLMITDIIKEGTELFAVGDTEMVERALGIMFKDAPTVWMPGVLSRKKQVAAKIVSES